MTSKTDVIGALHGPLSQDKRETTMRDEFERAAEQRLLTLFYAVRRIVDRGGAALPAGRAGRGGRATWQPLQIRPLRQ